MSGIDLSDLLVKPVAGHPDTFAFQFDFVPTGKALESGTAPVVTTADNGDLIIEGYAAVFDGVDREDENFGGGAFQTGVRAFLNGQAGLCYHHQHDKLLGKVLDLRTEEGKGLWMKARVDGEIQTHPELGTIYSQIKKGSLNALSVGGFFKRDYSRNKITGVDFTEISVTPVPVHPGTSFAVVAGKALLNDVTVPDKPEVGEVRESDVEQVKWITDELKNLFDRLEAAAAKRKTNTITVTT